MSEPMTSNAPALSLGDCIFRPRSVALIGASAEPANNNARPQRYLTEAGFAGRSLPVIGFDNTALAAGVGFSSIDQCLGEVASAALAALDHEPGGVTTIVRPRLMRRQHDRWGILPAADRGQSPT